MMPPLMATIATERVTQVRHWNDSLFSFRTTRDPAFRFESGQFVMLGLSVEGRPLLRAYSIASASYEDHLEFFSIKVPNGPLTSRLQHLAVNDEIFVSRKPSVSQARIGSACGRNASNSGLGASAFDGRPGRRAVVMAVSCSSVGGDPPLGCTPTACAARRYSAIVLRSIPVPRAIARTPSPACHRRTISRSSTIPSSR